MNLRSNQNGFGIFTILVIIFFGWATWSMINSVKQRQDESVDFSTEIGEEPTSKSKSQQATFQPATGYTGGGNASRTYSPEKGFVLNVSAVLPALPEEVHYQAYLQGSAGQVNLGQALKDVSTYKVEYTSVRDLFDDYDKVLIKVEGAEGTVEGIEVPFTASTVTFTTYLD